MKKILVTYHFTNLKGVDTEDCIALTIDSVIADMCINGDETVLGRELLEQIIDRVALLQGALEGAKIVDIREA